LQQEAHVIRCGEFGTGVVIDIELRAALKVAAKG